MKTSNATRRTIAFIGSAGIPNRYGGFEAFLEHCAPEMARQRIPVIVTCDAHLYVDRQSDFQGVRRLFISVPANGGMSVLHDFAAFLRVYREATHIIVLGVSGGLWFPFWRLACALANKRLLVNIDGVEWRRSKFSSTKRALLRVFDALAQWSAHRIVYDNAALAPFVLPCCRSKAVEIAYSGDHVIRDCSAAVEPGTALTICRIEPENNIEMLIEGALRSRLNRYTVIGNWSHSEFSRGLRECYKGEVRLELLDPVYDPTKLATLRERCAVYLHGHSVGGTNPSLVEMLFYDCRLLCFDCAFNRETAADTAGYFSNVEQLTHLLDSEPEPAVSRTDRRIPFTRRAIVAKYLQALDTPTPVCP